MTEYRCIKCFMANKYTYYENIIDGEFISESALEVQEHLYYDHDMEMQDTYRFVDKVEDE